MTKNFIYCPPEGKKYFRYFYKQITDFFKQDGYISINNANSLHEEKNTTIYNKFYSHISRADLIVLEVSIPNIEAGYIISKALELRKRVIALYLKGHAPDFLTGIKEDTFVLVEYKEDTLTRQIEAACHKAKYSADKRFNFFVSPDILNYLNKKTKATGTTKSAFIRQLIMDYSRRPEFA